VVDLAFISYQPETEPGNSRKRNHETAGNVVTKQTETEPGISRKRNHETAGNGITNQPETESRKRRMGRKKIQITRIADERNRQVRLQSPGLPTGIFQYQIFINNLVLKLLV
jgi:hypothetical protein